jgi:glycosyltransferase involved in cell wall biosynthesis
MKIAYFSPFSPDRSGIADFSEELVFELKKYMDVDIYSKLPVENEDIMRNFNLFDIDNYQDSKLSEYDQVVYQFGNNTRYHEKVIHAFVRHPGILELHDMSLHHYLAEDTIVKNRNDEYIRIMEYCHGEKGRRAAIKFLHGLIPAPWGTTNVIYTVNKHYVDMATGVIVHSDLAKQYIKALRPNVPIIHIPLHAPDMRDDFAKNKKECKKKLGIAEDTPVFGSFGYISSAKRVPQIMQALSEYKSKAHKNFIYYIVGHPENIFIKRELDHLMHQYKLHNNAVVTGFTTLDEFKTYMGACDICFNLRYPTQGESSASLHRMLGMGKPVMVSSIGSFEEYPDDIVAKIGCGNNEVADIYNTLISLMSSPATVDEMAAKAFTYAKENFDLGKNASRYYDFFLNTENYIHSKNYIDLLVDRMTEMGIIDQNYIRDFAVNKLDMFDQYNAD